MSDTKNGLKLSTVVGWAADFCAAIALALFLMVVRDVREVTILIERLKNIPEKVEALQSDVATIKASRFTATDGREVWQEIGRIREKIAILERASLVTPDPPKWFVDRMDRLESRFNDLDEQVRLLTNEHIKQEGRKDTPR